MEQSFNEFVEELDTELSEEERRENLIKEYHKRFADGEQYIKLTVNGIQEIEKDYYWQERMVYNCIKSLIADSKLSEDVLYGRCGLVSQLIPYQIAYNKLKNKKLELLLNPKVLLVEDGSVDVDSLENDGLAPGKIIVYRNGSTPPSNLNLEPSEKFLECFDREQDEILSIMRYIKMSMEEKYENNN